MGINFKEKPVHTPAALLLRDEAPATLTPEQKSFVARFADRDARDHNHINVGNDEKTTKAWARLLANDPQALAGLMEYEAKKDSGRAGYSR